MKTLASIGSALTAWEMTEVSYAYLFNTLVRPQATSIAIRRSYGSIIASRGRREMIKAAGEAFFHAFPSASLEPELKEFMNIHTSASDRRNEIAHGVVYTGLGSRGGFYLEANDYNNKRDLRRQSPYAYTSEQITKLAKGFTGLRRDVEAFRRTLKEHFQSADPKDRERY